MNVRTLMQILSTQDPDAEVSLVLEPNWPREHRIAGVMSRADLVENTAATLRRSDGMRSTDVLIVQGDWQRKSDPEVWDIAMSHVAAPDSVARRHHR